MSQSGIDLDKQINVMGDEITDVDGEQALKVDVDGRQHTLELRKIFGFEEIIIQELISSDSRTNVSGAAVPFKGRWIHEWLFAKGEDYINSIWHGYQYFVKYLEKRTERFENVETFNRNPGTYQSMYRFIIALEELEVLERFKRVQIPLSEYDQFVPEEMRTRTFVRITEPYQDAQDKWDNPFDELYCEFRDQEREEQQPEEPEDDIEEQIEEDSQDEVEIPEPDVPEVPERGTVEELPEENASFVDFNQKEDILGLINAFFTDSLEQTIDQTTLPIPQEVNPDDFSLGRVAVIGPWAMGTAIPGQTELDLFVSIDDTQASISPGALPAGLQQNLPDLMDRNNIYSDIFPSYNVVGLYNRAFKDQLKKRVKDQDEPVFYSFQENEIVEVE